MERNRRRQNTKEKRTAIWKRCIAAAVAMVTVLTGFNYDGLANVFAKETSGYQIDVSYSEDKTSAVLTGNVGNVPAGTTLTAMTGADGTEYDPNSFQMTVTENGTYTYTLEYNVSVAETGQTVEQKETLEVTVDQITAKQTASKTTQSTGRSASGLQSGSQADASSQSNSTAQQAVTADSTEAPETVPLAELKAELATLAGDTGSGDGELDEATYNVYQYAYEEKGLSLTNGASVSYTGGLFTENAPVYTESGITRNYKEAALVIIQEGIDEEVGIAITGLYPYSLQAGNTEWYYTTASNTESTDDGYGIIQVGYRLPDNAQVRLYYEVPDNPRHNVVFETNGVSSITPSEYQLKVKNTNLSNLNASVQAVPTERVSVEFNKPTGLEYMVVRITSVNGKQLAAFDTRNLSSTGLRDEGSGTYSGSFVMENTNVVIAIEGHIYGTVNRWFTAFSSIDADPSLLSASYPKSVGMSRTYTLEIGGTTVATPRYQDDGGGNVYYDSWGGSAYGGWKKPGYGLKNYISGGVPYTHTFRIPGNSTGDNYTFAASKTATAGDTASTPGTGTGKVGVKLTTDSNAKTFTAPVKNFTAGSKVKVRFETAIRNTDTQPWNVVPNSLAVDVYTEQGQFATTNFTRETFALPRTQGRSITYNLDTGGTVTIECKTYNGGNVYNNPSESWSSHERRFQDGYMFSTAFLKVYNLNNLIPAWESPTSFTGRVADMKWFAYEVTVQGVYHDFKLYQTVNAGAHRNAILEFDDTAAEAVILNPDVDGDGGADQSTIESDMTRNGARSYTFLKMAQQDTRAEYRALELPFTFRTFMKPANSAIMLALAVRQGYSPPSVTSTGDEVSVSPQGYSNGVYKYNITLGSSDGNRDPGTIAVSSKAVEFRAQFWANNANINSPDLIRMGYGSNQSRNYVIIPTQKVLDQYPTLDHFEVHLVKIEGTNIGQSRQIQNMDNENNWHTGDIINYDDVYTQAANAGFLDRSVGAYRLEIRPIVSTTGNARVDGTYLIKQQTAFSSGDIYQSSSFNQTASGTVEALQNSKVVIVGYKDQIVDNATHKHFKLGLRSKTSGILSQQNAVVGDLYYLAAVQASIDATDVKELENDQTVLDEIDAWNEQNKEKLYTGVNNESHFVKYTDIYTTLKDKYPDFKGFKIKDATTGEIYEYTLPEESGVNLYLIGGGSSSWNYTANLELWNALFTESGTSRGQLVLVPTYEEDSKIVSDADSGAISISSPTDKESITDQSVEMKASFYYTGDKTTAYTGLKFAVTKQEFQRNATTGEIDTSQQTAAGRDPGQRNKLVAYGDITQAADGATNVTVNGPYGTSGGNNKITFASWEENEAVQSFTLGLNIGVNNLTYQWDHDAVYTIHMWNDGNEPGNINDNLSVWAGGNEGAWSEDSDTNVTNNFLTASPLKIPGVSATTKVYPKKVVTTGEAISHTEGTEESATPGDGNGIQEYENVNLTTAFTIDSKYPIDLQLKTEEEILAAAGGTSTAGTADERAKARIHTALLKRNPPGAQSAADTDPDWEAWIYDTTTTNSGRQSSNADKVRRTVFESANGNTQVKVTYELVNQGTSLNWRWEDKAQYELFAWNDTNESGISLTGGESVIQTSLESALNKKSGTAYSKVPSSIYEINLAWLEPTYYVSIPTGIIMTDDGDNKDGSGASADDWAGVEVTVRYKDSSEGNDADTQPVVDVSVSDSVTLTSTTDGNKVLTANVYDSNGDLMPASGGKVAIGQLKHNTSGTGEQTVTPVPSLTYYLNANKTGIIPVKGEIFTGKQTFDLTLQNYQRYIQNP